MFSQEEKKICSKHNNKGKILASSELVFCGLMFRRHWFRWLLLFDLSLATTGRTQTKPSGPWEFIGKAVREYTVKWSIHSMDSGIEEKS